MEKDSGNVPKFKIILKGAKIYIEKVKFKRD